MLPTDLSTLAQPLPPADSARLVEASQARVGLVQGGAVDLNFAAPQDIPLPQAAIDAIRREADELCASHPTTELVGVRFRTVVAALRHAGLLP